MTFGYQCDRRQSFAIIDAAAEAGISFLDTADMYPPGSYPEGQGRTEEIIGEWLTGRREQFIVASKCFFPSGRRPWESGNSRHNIMRSVEGSLRRLGTDYIDLYQVHSWDQRTPIDETLTALDDLVHSGKARYVGASNLLAYQLARSLGRTEVLGTTRFDSVQPRYNLLYRDVERELLPLFAEERIAVIPYNPLAGGFLTGKHRNASDPANGTRFGEGNQGRRYQDRYWHQRSFDLLDDLQVAADESGVSMATLAVQWVLSNPSVTSPIVGASHPDQLDDALRAVELALDPRIERRLHELTAEFCNTDPLPPR
jgi:aryl-alcohol dehydrogenase (NADP+)